MWIIPSTHPLYSAFAPECVQSKEELKELSDQLEQSLMWRQKHLPLKTWSLKWNKVYWLPQLFTRMLKPSQAKSFETKFMESLEDIRVSENHLSDSSKELMMNDSFGRILKELSKQADLFGDSLKMSQTTSTNLSHTFLTAYDQWATELRSEYSQRLSQALHILGKEFSSSLWTTPTSRDWKDTPGMKMGGANGRDREDQLPRQVFSQCHTAYLKDLGRNPGLISGMNPAWVLQLMGTTLEKTFFAWQEMESLNKQQN